MTVWYGMVPPQPPVSVFRLLRVVASFSTCPTREASGGPVNQRLFEDGFACAGGGTCSATGVRVTGASHLQPDDFGCVGAHQLVQLQGAYRSRWLRYI
jgi:coenzyme F420-reducing hydrogenase gamma subunit